MRRVVVAWQVGRSAAGWRPSGESVVGVVYHRWVRPLPSRLGGLAGVRVVLVPLLLLCHVEGSALPVVLSSDAWPCVLMVVLALSNGYLSSLAMMDGPLRLAHPAHRELAGTTMVLLLTLGLSAGSGLSFLVLAVSSKGKDAVAQHR